jgi:flavin-dependent dehydrogenase
MSAPDDVLIVGAGPAGAVAATVLARAGARVRLIDRATFPRDKLCGDTINPGTMAILRRLGMSGVAERHGVPIEGMLVTGEGAAVRAPYPDGVVGRSLSRRDLDAALVQHAVDAGARFEYALAARRPLVEHGRSGPRVSGCIVAANGVERRMPSRVVIAADGRRSRVVSSLGLARHPARPRRWAIGGYFEGVRAISTFGEMHVRRGRYVGIAPLPGGLTNACLVRPWVAVEEPGADPEGMLRRELAADSTFGWRFERARLVVPPRVLGPLAADVADVEVLGLLLAGDAAGFVDPMTGDGLRFAVRGGELAGLAALAALERGWAGVHRSVGLARRAEFQAKWRFDRVLRALVSSSAALRVAGIVAPRAPALVRAIVRTAGDCALAS